MKLVIPQPVREIFNRFQKAGFEVFLVGAGSRNLLTGKEAINCDFTTNATPEQSLKLFPQAFYNNIYGTVGIPIEGETRAREIYEITTYRTEGSYSDRRRPDKVRWGKVLEEDLARRSFTISAIAIGPKRESGKNGPESKKVEIVHDRAGKALELVDLFGGRQDLEKRVIRAIGDPNARFQEDALRLMRAVRIASQLGFLIEEKTFAAILNNRQLLKHVAAERVRDELFKILASQHPADGIKLLFNAGLLEVILPELTAGYGVNQTGHHQDDVFGHSVKSLRYCPSADPVVRLATLLHDIGKMPTRAYLCSQCQSRFKEGDLGDQRVVCPRCGFRNDEHEATTFYNHEVVGTKLAKKMAQRLKLSKKQQDKLVTLIRWHQFSVDEHQTDKAIRRFIRNVGKENLKDIIDLRVGDRIGSGTPPLSWRLKEFLARIEEVQKQPFTVADLKVDGHDVMKILKIKPGPRVGEVLQQLFAEVEEDLSKNSRPYLLDRLKTMT